MHFSLDFTIFTYEPGCCPVVMEGSNSCIVMTESLNKIFDLQLFVGELFLFRNAFPCRFLAIPIQNNLSLAFIASELILSP